MKKITLLLLFVCTLSFSQVSVSTIEKSTKIGSAKGMTCTKKGNQYIFTYKDTKYQQITDIKGFAFIETGNDFEKLYQVFMGGFRDLPENELRVDVYNGHLNLSFYKNTGKPLVKIVHVENGVYGYPNIMNEKSINKIFGR